MIKRILQAISSLFLVAALLSGFLPVPASTSVVQARQPASIQPANLLQPAFAPDHVLVKLRSPIQTTAQSPGHSLTGSAHLDQTLAQAGGRGLKPLFATPQSPSLDHSGLSRIYRLNLNPGQNVQDTLALLSADPNVEYAEPDYLAQMVTAPNDPHYAEQWGLGKIEVEGAWDQTSGSPSVIIAVIDSGIDLTHEDLVDNLWMNPGEDPTNSIDDDSNGFVNDMHGWNFVAGTSDVSDDNGHGTLVAGIAAARTNNGVGISGVCGECRIMPVKVMQASGTANYSDIAAGINYAVVKGARVINLSLGGYANSRALQDAVNNALAQNIVVVAGSGNDASANPFYPAAYDGVISVAATDSADLKAAFSNYGAWVKLSAPGVDVLTTSMDGAYISGSGTSQASPFVSGLAGLLLTLHPDWTPAMVLAQLTHTADGIDGLNPGFEGKLGAGRINATQAVQPAVPVLSYGGYSANGTPNGRPNYNADVTLTVSLQNDWADARGVSAVLSTTDPAVSVNTGTADFGDILSGQARSNNTPYAIHIAAAAGYNHAIPFSLAVSANGGAYTNALNFSVTTLSSIQNVSGTISTTRTWTNDKTYIVTNNIGIPPTVTLTIQPGTTVKFNAGFSLNVGGTLVANGTQDQPIRFISNTASAWGRIYFDDGGPDAVVDGSGAYLSGSILRWVQMQGAGQGIACNSATPYLSHLTTDAGGINCTAGNTSLWLADSDVTGSVNILGIPDTPWRTRAAMPTPREYLAAATASNGKIYAVGGDTGFSGLVNEEYDPVSNTWASRADMLTGGGYGVGLTATSDGMIYAVGGSGATSDVVEKYDPSTDTWTPCASIPTPRRWFGLTTASNGKIYAIGGENGSGFLGSVEEYDPAANTWATRASMPTPRRFLGVTSTSDGKIYAIGGYNNGELTTVEEYDVAENSWTTRASMPVQLINNSIMAAVSNDRIYAIGGWGTVEEYNPATNTWRIRPSLPTARYGFAISATSNGKIYAIGGNGGNLLGTNEEFDASPSVNGSFNVRITTIRSGNLSIQEDSQVIGSTIGGSVTVGNSIPGYTSIVQNTTTLGAITVNGSGTVTDNTVSGGISISSGDVLSNALTGGGIVAGGGSLVQGNDIQNASSWSIDTSGSVTISRNRMVGGANGVRLQNGSLTGNLIANLSGTGLEINGSPTASDNTFTAIAGSTIDISSGTPGLHTNNLEFNTGTYDLVNNTINAIDASGNWWGTTDPDTIAARIFDYGIDYTKGLATFIPALTGPSQSAPAYVRSLTIDPNPVGIQTANFTVEFSRPMDVSKKPQITFGLAVEGSWKAMANMPTPRHYLGVVSASNGKIYAIGGANNSTGSLSTVEEFDPSTNTWATKASMPTARYYLGVAAASNGKIYAIGGTSNNGILAVVEEYDPSVNTWTTKASMPTAREALGVAAASNGKVYAIGGDNDGTYFATVEEYDPSTDTWSTKASMPTAREGLGVATGSNGKIYAIGGYLNYGGALNVVEEYDPFTNTWMAKANLPIARLNLGVAAANNGKIYAIGGTYATNTAAVEEFNPSTNTWTTRVNLPTERTGLGVAAAGNGKLYAIGGWNGAELATNVEYTPGWGFDNAASNPQWLDTLHYRASYDFTTLIPRGKNQVTTQDAWGTDSLAIPPYRGPDLVVDYAGSISVTTPPNSPVVSAWGDGSLTTLNAFWTATDPNATITGYRYAIGTTAGGTDVVNWTNISGHSLTRSGLNLVLGQTYYISVKAGNAGGLWSPAGWSFGVKAGVKPVRLFIPTVRK